MHLCHTFNKRK